MISCVCHAFSESTFLACDMGGVYCGGSVGIERQERPAVVDLPRASWLSCWEYGVGPVLQALPCMNKLLWIVFALKSRFLSLLRRAHALVQSHLDGLLRACLVAGVDLQVAPQLH